MKWITILFLSCLCASGAVLPPRQTIYFQDFERVGKPDNWTEWNYLQNHADTWNIPSAQALDGTNSIKFSYNNPALAIGAFYDLPYPIDDIKVHLMFKTGDYPSASFIEILDMYDSIDNGGDEICDIYLGTDGKLLLFAGGPSTGSTTDSIPTNVTCHIWVRYINNVGSPSTATAAWSTNSTEPTSGTQFVSRSDGGFHFPVTRLLVGPVTDSDVNFWYDNFEVTVPAPVVYPPRNLELSGVIQIRGTNTFR